MKTLALLAAVAIAASAAHAAPQPWTLDSCLNYAAVHNLTVRQRELQQRGGELSVTEARSKYLPTASASSTYSMAFGRGLTASNVYADRNTSSLNWNIGVELPLFQGLSAYRQEKVAKANLLALIEQTEAARDDIQLQVIGYYLQALYCREMTDVAREQLRISQVEADRRKVLLENGKIPELDLIQARAQVASDSVTVVNADNDLSLALLDLALLLQVDSHGFNIAPLQENPTLTPDADTVVDNALTFNHSMVAARRNIDVADRQIDLARTGYIPRLSFHLGLGSTYYKVNGEQNLGFGKQMRENYSTNLGFSLSIPLFDAFSTRNSIRRAKLQRLEADLNYETAAQQLERNVRQAYLQASAAERKQQATATAQASTKAALEAMTEKYNFGRANATEFENAKSAFIKASSEAVQARYELILRRKILDFYNRH